MGRDTAAPIPEKLEYEDSTMATAAAVLVYAIDDAGVAAAHPLIERTFSSGGGYHAEEKVLLYLRAKVTDGTLTHHNALRADYLVVLQVSKSPCSSTSDPATRTDGKPGCHELLLGFMEHGLTDPAGQKVIFLLRLAATKPYQPPIAGAKQASKDSYDGFGGGGATFGFVRT